MRLQTLLGLVALAGVALAIGWPGVGHTASTGYVRVNQLGYGSSAAKQAFLMAPVAETGATFSVVNVSTGATAYSAPVAANRGSWSRSFPDVYALNFDALTTAGTYRILVTGPAPASSPTFTIGTPTAVYGGAIANALSFYENERDGANFIPSALRTAPGHLNDTSAKAYFTPAMNSNGHFAGDLTPTGSTLDASGGWWDAGDYLKFVETTSYTVSMLDMGVRDFPAEMGATAPSGANFTNEVAFGTDFLLRIWDDSTKTLYYQVGIGNGNSKTVSDHDIWRLPQADDTYGGCTFNYRYICHRPVFQAAPAGSLISPNLAGRLAADFALCFQLDHASNPTLANRCLLDAEHIFDLANTNPGQLLTSAPYGFYPETEWRDDLELGATELYKALALGGLPASVPHTDPIFYLSAAANWANAYITGPGDAADTLNLYDVSGTAHYELYNAITQAGSPSGLAVSKAGLLADLKKQLDKAGAQAATDPFGFGFPWATFDTTTHGAGLAVMASEYDHLTASSTYVAFGVRQLANILGANAWGVSLIVGDGSTFPDCMQHQVANLMGSTNGSPPVLAGAAVEGPNSFAASGLVSGMVTCPPNGVDVYAPFNSSSAVFQDNVQSFSTVEPAIDLTASSPLAFAWQIAP